MCTQRGQRKLRKVLQSSPSFWKTNRGNFFPSRGNGTPEEGNGEFKLTRLILVQRQKLHDLSQPSFHGSLINWLEFQLTCFCFSALKRPVTGCEQEEKRKKCRMTSLPDRIMAPNEN